MDTDLTVVNILGDQITIPYTLKLNENNIYDLIIENGYYPGHNLASDTEGKSINFIYNAPDATTIDLSNARNAYGHLVSPQATVYDEMGNFNGGVIAKNYYSRSETHFWPLKVDEEIPTPMTEYTVLKKWENVDDLALPSIKVNLYKNGEVFKTIELDGSEDWTYTWTDLEKYDEHGKEYTYAVDEVEVPKGFEKSVEGNVITNTFKEVEPEIEYTEYTVIKKWENVENFELPTIKINLYRNGKIFKTVELDGSEDWTYTWTDLEKYDENGEEYTYTVDEVTVPKGFEKSVEGNVITNTFKEVEPEIEYTEYTVIKKWENVDDLDLPSIKVNLYRNGEVFKTIELDGSEDWTYTWTDLEKYDEHGKEYTYAVDEVEVPKGFEKTVEGNVITNTYIRTGEVLPATGVSGMSFYSSVSMIVAGLYILFKKD